MQGDYELLGKSEFQNNKHEWLYNVRCKICGSEKLLTSDSLQRNTYFHSSLNCGDIAYLDEIDNIYGDYKVISYIGKRGIYPLYSCICLVCGRIKVFQMGNLKEGKGIEHWTCINSIPANKYKKILKSRWANMRDRTTNPNNERYPIYGNRGITSDDFKYFVDFYDAMIESFIEFSDIHGINNTTLERINVDGNYELSNLTWATWKEQANNKQDTVYFKAISPTGVETVEYGIGKYEQEHNMTHNIVFNRVQGDTKADYKGWKFEPILLT